MSTTLGNLSSSPQIKKILHSYHRGLIDEKTLIRKLHSHFYRSYFMIVDDVAHLDQNRSKHSGIEEVVFAEGKSYSILKKIVFALLDTQSSKSKLLITRLDKSVYQKLADDYQIYNKTAIPLYYVEGGRIAYKPNGKKSISAGKGKKNISHIPKKKDIAIVTAGSSDIMVAEECSSTLSYWDYGVVKYYDVGVAGLGRLLGLVSQIKKARVIVVIAGMEAALASVLGGLVKSPIIAVPTSVGYGANFKGLSALLGMLNSCSPGVSVVNIDNGFGAACVARKILQM